VTAPGGATASAVWVDVLPSMKGFGAELGKQSATAAGAAGATAGKSFSKALIAGAAVIGVGALAAGKALYEVGQTFDRVTDTIRVGTGATGKALDSLVNDAKSVGRNVPASFDEIGVAVADLNTRLGLTGKPLQRSAEQFLNLSRITGTDLQQNIAGITRVFGDWGIAAKDQAGALDAIYRASQATGAGVDTLSQQVVQFGAPLRQMGFSFEQALAMFGKFEKEGVNIETVMSGMRQGLGRMAKAGEAPVETFKRVSEQIKNAGSVGEANAISLELFGQRAGPDMAAAIREGKFELDDLVDTIANGKDTINAAAKDTLSFAESWQIFKNRALLAIEPIATRLFIALGKGMEWFNNVGGPALSNFAGIVSRNLDPALSAVAAVLNSTVIPAVRAVGRFISDNRKPITIVAGLIASLFIPHWIALGTTATVEAAKNVAAWVTTRTSAVKSAVVHSAQVVKMVAGWALLGARSTFHAAKVVGSWLLVGAISAAAAVADTAAAVGKIVARWAFMGAQSLLHAAKVAAAWVVAMGPIGWAIAAVVALVAAVILNWDKVKKVTVAAWKAVSGAVTAAWDWITTKTAQAWTWITTKFTQATTFVKRMWDGFWNGLLGFFRRIVDLIMAGVRAWWSNLQRNFQTAVRFIRGLWDRFWNGLRDTATRIFDTVKNAIGTSLNWVRDKFRGIVDAIGRIWNNLRGLLARPINFMINTVWNGGILRAWNRVRDWIPGLPEAKRLEPIRWAQGGIHEDHQAQLARGGDWRVWAEPETHGEAYIPLAQSKRARSTGILADVAERFGYGLAPRELALFADGGLYRRMFDVVKGQFPQARLNSGYRRGDPGWHGRGHAVDLGQQGRAGGVGHPYLAAMNRWLHDNFRNSTELIYTGRGDDRPDLKNGRPLNYGGAVNAQHRNHVHWALAAAEMLGGAKGGGGGFWGWIGDRIRALVERITNPLLDRMAKPPPQWMGVPGNAARMFRDKALDFFLGQAGEDAAPGSGPVVDQVRGVSQRFGWGGGRQWNALYELIRRESSWNPRAQNPVSTAYGLYQFLNSTWATVGGYKTSNPGLQAEFGNRYIQQRYGNPAAAVAFHDRNNWYDEGGMLPPGWSTVYNGSRKPEPVLSDAQWQTISRAAQGEGGGALVGRDLVVMTPPGASEKTVVDEAMFALRRERHGGGRRG
jgi:TP901 family phage tail tape measure protein